MQLDVLIARYQYRLSLLLIVGYMAMVGAAAAKFLDGSLVREFGTPVGLVIMYWFQRQRHQSKADGDSDAPPSSPTQPVDPASVQQGVKS